MRAKWRLLKPQSADALVCLDTAVVVIDGMTVLRREMRDLEHSSVFLYDLQLFIKLL